jgi:hypothetical protein
VFIIATNSLTPDDKVEEEDKDNLNFVETG